MVSGLFLFSWYNPTYWSLEVKEIVNANAEEVELVNVKHNYRTIPLTAKSYIQEISYTAGPIVPHSTPITLFLIFQVIAWALVLAAATMIRSRWVYAFYFLFALFLYFSNVLSILLPIEGTRLIGLLLIIPFLIFAYLFQMNTLRWDLYARFFLFLGLLSIIFGIVFLKGDTAQLYQTYYNLLLYLGIVGAVLLFFLGKEPLNLLIVATTNRPQKEQRWGLRTIVILFVLLFFSEFLMLQDQLRFSWIPIENIGIRPIHLIFVAAIFTVFTSQNQFHQVRDMFTTNVVYTFLLLAWVIIGLSSFWLAFAVTDLVYIRLVERLSIIFFFGIGLFQFIFIISNHYQLLKEKVNLFYLLMYSRRFPVFVIWVMAIGCFIIFEGRESWKTPRFFIHTIFAGEGDVAMLKGENSAAMVAYQSAARIIPASSKANYNIASMLVSNPRKIDSTLICYQNANKVYKFPYGVLNAANLLSAKGQTKDAQTLLRRSADRENSHYLYNNLALTYLQNNQPDSAIIYFKKALLRNGKAAPIYSNLANVYFKYESKYEIGSDFLKAGIKASKQNGSAIANSIHYNLKGKADIPIPSVDIDEYDEFFVKYNYALYLLEEGEKQQAVAQLKKLVKDETSLDALLLNVYLDFEQDSIANALSRVEFMAENYEEYIAPAYYLLGTCYFQRNVPEMAKLYYQKAGEAGDPKGTLMASKMNLDLGEKDSAQVHLSELRVKYPDLWEEASKELAILLAAYGQTVFAQTESDLSQLTLDEQVRISLYADSTNQYIIATDNFRNIITQDSTSAIPYLELGKIYNKYNDSLAIENLEYGLEIQPDNIPLKLELARAYIQQNQINKAQTYLGKIKDAGQWEVDHSLLQAKVLIATDKAEEGLKKLQEINKEHPLNQECILELANLYRTTNDTDAGYRLIYDAINFNNQNPYIWYYYAHFAKAWNQEEDAGFGAIKALELCQDKAQKEVIRNEFADEIKLATQGSSGQ